MAREDMLSATSERVVILGAGHAGLQCAATLRQLGFGHPILMIGAEDHLPYDRPPLSKAWLKGGLAEERLLLRKPAFYAEKGIDILLGTAVVAIDPDARRLHLADRRKIAYGALVLATGAAPRALPRNRISLTTPQASARLLTLRSLADAGRLKGRLAESRSLLVIGGGYIGLEVAASARTLGLTVTVIEATDKLMPRLGSPPVSAYFAALHREHGVTIRLSTRLDRLVAGEDGVRVALSDGAILAADCALVGIGARARTELAESAGIACDDGILVDAQLRTSVPTVFAIGDVARLRTSRYGSIRLESIQNANDSAQIAARAIAGDAQACYDPLPWFWTEQFGVRLQSVGLAQNADRHLLRGDPESGSFSVLHLDAGNRLLALDSVNTPRDFMQAKKLIASGARIDRVRARDPDIALKETALDAAHDDVGG